MTKTERLAKAIEALRLIYWRAKQLDNHDGTKAYMSCQYITDLAETVLTEDLRASKAKEED